MGGVCFTCGGDGIVNTFSTIKLNRMTMKYEMRDYLKHSSNRDLATLFSSGEYTKLQPTQQLEARYELFDRAGKYYSIETDGKTAEEVGSQVISKLDELEKSMPKPYEKNGYFQAGKVDLVPVHWLKKFQGNDLRIDRKELDKFGEGLKKDGLKEPVMISIGQRDRQVSVGEGNHRMNAFINMGMDYIPARVTRGTDNYGAWTYYYDKMSRVPLSDYFPADAKPTDVFDTMYDHGDFPPLDDKAMKKMEYDKVDIPLFADKEIEFTGKVPKGIYGQQFQEVSKTLIKQLNEMVEKYYDLKQNDSSFELILSESLEWYSKSDGIMLIQIEEAIENLGEEINTIELEKYFGYKKKEYTPTEDSEELSKMLDELDDWDFDEYED